MTPEILSLIKDSVAVKFFDNGKIGYVLKESHLLEIQDDCGFPEKAFVFSSTEEAVQAMNDWDGEGDLQ